MCGAALLGIAPGDAVAHHVFFTFAQPVEVPGSVTLPAGRYEVRTIESTADRRVIEVRDAGGKVHATILSVPAAQSASGKKAQVRLIEVSQFKPPAMLSWWDGEGAGFEVVYPQGQATRIGIAAQTSVAMSLSPISTAAELKSAKVTRWKPASVSTGTSASTPTDITGEIGSHGAR
jgi:hypothetical protein